MKLELLKHIIQESKHLVCISGLGMLKESGYPNYRDDAQAYAAEMEYGYSPEEILSAVTYATRPELFYDYYKKHVLFLDKDPGEAYYCLAKLEKMNILKATITRSMYSLANLAGCKKVINLQGSIYKNYCPDCKKTYPAIYLKNSPRVPVCRKCQTMIRPGIRLHGEMIDNRVMTKMAEEVSKADNLLIMGANFNSPVCKMALKYFSGQDIVLINPDDDYYHEEQATVIFREEAREVLPAVLELIEQDLREEILA